MPCGDFGDGDCILCVFCRIFYLEGNFRVVLDWMRRLVAGCRVYRLEAMVLVS